MNRMKTILIIFVILILINASALAFATTRHYAKHFDIKVSTEGKAGYKGTEFGNLFLVKIEITNPEELNNLLDDKAYRELIGQ